MFFKTFFKTFVGYVLTMCWTFFGHVLYFLTIVWTFFGHFLGQFQGSAVAAEPFWYEMAAAVDPFLNVIAGRTDVPPTVTQCCSISCHASIRVGTVLGACWVLKFWIFEFVFYLKSSIFDLPGQFEDFQTLCYEKISRFGIENTPKNALGVHFRSILNSRK